MIDPEVRDRFDRLDESIVEMQKHVAGSLEWRLSVDHRLVDHHDSIEKLKAWQFKLIGAYLGAAVLCGVAFQVLLRMLP